MRIKLAFILLLSFMLLGCLGLAERDLAGNCIGSCPPGTHQPSPDECVCVADDWVSSWEVISLTVVLTLFFVIAMLYMLATAFDMQRMKLILRDEYIQAIASGLFILLLGAFTWSAYNVLLPSLAQPLDLTDADVPPSFLPAFSPTGAIDAFVFAEQYTKEITSKLEVFIHGFEASALGVGQTGTVTTYCQILGSSLGFAISPCRYLMATQGTLSLSITALYSATVAMWAQMMLLQIGKVFIFFLLPLGVLLRSIRFTRSAGGALIAIAVGFYIVYPLMVVADYALVKDDIFMDSATGIPPPYASIAIPPGPHHEQGACRGDAEYLSTLMNRSAFLEPMAYWVIIVSILLPVMNLLVTITFIRWLSSFIGSEIEVSQLARVV